MRLAVCTPTHSGELHYATVGTLLRLSHALQARGDRFDHIVTRSPWVAYSRDDLAQQALALDADWILYLDADVGICDPAGALDRLIALDVDIGGALYHSKPVMGSGATGQAAPAPFSSAVVTSLEPLSWRILRAPQAGVLRGQLLLAGGAMLVRPSVFQRLPAPWFQFREYVDERGTRAFVSEDWVFCAAALRAGMTTAADASIATEHHGTCGWRHEGR